MTRQVMMKVTWLVVVAFLAAELAIAQQPEIATAVSFTEGPTVDREGNVYFSEMVSLRIMKLSASGQLSTFREHSNNANGLLIDPEGRLVACEGADSTRTGVSVKFKPQVTRTDLGTGKIEVLADSYEGKPFVGPNDVTIDGKGRLYLHRSAGRRGVSNRRPRSVDADSWDSGNPAAERDSDLT